MVLDPVIQTTVETQYHKVFELKCNGVIRVPILTYLFTELDFSRLSLRKQNKRRDNRCTLLSFVI